MSLWKVAAYTTASCSETPACSSYAISGHAAAQRHAHGARRRRARTDLQKKLTHQLLLEQLNLRLGEDPQIGDLARAHQLKLQ
jgi:hypothetical protein